MKNYKLHFTLYESYDIIDGLKIFNSRMLLNIASKDDIVRLDNELEAYFGS